MVPCPLCRPLSPLPSPRADEARLAEAARKHGYADIFLRIGDEVLSRPLRI